MFSKGGPKAQRMPQKVTLSVKNYNSDKLQFGVPVKKSEASRLEPQLGSLQTQPIEINMDYRPYRTGRLSMNAIDVLGDSVSHSGNLSDFTASDCSSDTESGRFSKISAIQYDAQRTSAFSQVATNSGTEKKKSSSIQNS